MTAKTGICDLCMETKSGLISCAGFLAVCPDCDRDPLPAREAPRWDPRVDVLAATLSRLDEVFVSSAPGMTVDGDVLHDAVMDAVPNLLTDDAARDIAKRVLDGCVRSGMVVLHGPGLTPRKAPS